MNQIIFLQLQNNRLFNGFNIKKTWFAGMKTADVCNPVVFCSKLNNMFIAFFVGTIHFEASRRNECVMPANITFLEDELLSPYFSFDNPFGQDFPFLAIQGKILIKIRNECTH